MIYHGNAHFRLWFLLCVFCVAVFSLAPRLFAADVVDIVEVVNTKAVNVSFPGPGGLLPWTAVVHIDEYYLEYHYSDGSVSSNYSRAYARVVSKSPDAYYTQVGFGAVNYLGQFYPIYNGSVEGTVLVIYDYYSGYDPATSVQFTVGQGVTPAVSYTAKLTNYSSSPHPFAIMAGSTSVGTGVIPANGSIDQIFEFTAAEGALITIVPEPTYASNYDPAVVTASNNVFERIGTYGTPPKTFKVRFLFINYGSATVPVDIYATANAIGHCDATGGPITSPPVSTVYDYELPLPRDAIFTFVVPDGHTATYSSYSLHDGVNTFVVSIDRGDDQLPPSFGGSGLTGDGSGTGDSGTGGEDGDDPNSGGGVIVVPPTEGRPGTVIEPPRAFKPGSNTGGGVSGTGSVGNVVGSGANSTDAAGLGYLKEIKDNTEKTSDVSDMQHKGAEGIEGRISAVDSASEHAAAQTDAQLIGDAANDALARLPAAEIPDVPDVGDGGDPYVDMAIAPGKTVRMYLNPFSPNGPMAGTMRTAASWLKRLIAYGLVMAFMIRLVQEIRLVMGTIFLTNPSPSQLVDIVSKATIFGNSAGVPVALGLRVLLIALTVSLLATIPLLIIAALEAGLPFPWFSQHVVSGPPVPSPAGPGVLATAFALSSYIVPWATCLAVPVWYYLLHQILFPLQVFWQALMRRLP